MGKVPSLQQQLSEACFEHSMMVCSGQAIAVECDEAATLHG